MDIYHRLVRNADSSILVEWEAINLSRETFEEKLREELDGFSDAFVAVTLKIYDDILDTIDRFQTKRVSGGKFIILEGFSYSTVLIIEERR